MGNCIGRCLPGKNSLRYSTDGKDEGDDLVSQDETAGNSIIFKIIKFKKKKRPHFIDEFWERQDTNNYARLNQSGSIIEENSEIQLQCLDAQTLLVTTARDHYNHHHHHQQQQPPTTKFDSIPQNSNIGGYVSGGGGVMGAGVASSSRASSSLDLEWEHEYAAAAAALTHNNSDNSHRKQQQSWYFLPEELSSRITASYNEINNYDTPEKQSNYNSTNNLLGSHNNITLIKHPSIVQLQQNNNYNNISNNNSSSNSYNKGIYVRTPSRTSWSHISTPESLEWDIDEDQQKQLRVEDDNLDHETLELLHGIEMLKNKVLNETGDGLEMNYQSS